jgi:hypothetical protein
MFFQQKKVYDNGIQKLFFCQDGTITTLDDKPYEPRKNKQGYAVITKVVNEIYANDKTCHTIMNQLFLPSFPACPITDHWDGNRLNFHLQNLNPVSTSINNINKTRAKGFDKLKDPKYRDSPEMRFQSRIRFKGKRHKLGQFETEKEAYNRTKGARMMIYWMEWDYQQTKIEKNQLDRNRPKRKRKVVFDPCIYIIESESEEEEEEEEEQEMNKISHKK